MGWQDRDYNSGRDQLNGYLANPAGLLQLSVPIYKRPSFYIRLHFWFLLIMVFRTIEVVLAKEPLYVIPLDFSIVLGAVLFHEWGHRIFAQMVGGNHWEWVLWPLGGMVPPTAPQTPKAVFSANIGGVLFSAVLGGLAAGLLVLLGANVSYFLAPNPFGPVHTFAISTAGISHGPSLVWYLHSLTYLLDACAAITVINLFPAFWFDGGRIWQSILWPWLGQWRATMVACMAGMILSVPFLLISLVGRDILGLFVWALIFASCFTYRRTLAASGPGVMEDEGPSYNYMDTPEPRRRKLKKRWFRSARKRARSDQAEQAKIDTILAKVKEKGLHSLTWWEKRALKKATERQRQRDLAERM